MERIGIFCSAADDIEAVYFEKARELGAWMGQNKKTLVYGGANIGLMECVAQSAKEHGAFIMGVVPTKLEERGAVSDLLDVTFRVDNLSERKDAMLRESDIFIEIALLFQKLLQSLTNFTQLAKYRALTDMQHSGNI